jgi:hypothetical protein
MNDELRSIWKEATVAYFKVLSQHLRAWIEKIYKHFYLF